MIDSPPSRVVLDDLHQRVELRPLCPRLISSKWALMASLFFLQHPNCAEHLIRKLLGAEKGRVYYLPL